jgi:GH43 family beta-xylosidase
MYYTAHWGIHEKEALRIGVAVSDSPLGPFVDVFDKAPMFDPGYGLLDGHLFCDVNKSGKNYFYYSCAGEDNIINGHKEADIFVVELKDDYITPVGEHKLIIKTDQPWETSCGLEQYWNEGPFIVEHDGKYHLMYSANFYASKQYGVGAAVSDSPLGPFVKYPGNPILKYIEGELSGPGHNSVIQSTTGELLCIYHAHTDYNRPSGNRQVYISPMSFVNGKLTVDYK